MPDFEMSTCPSPKILVKTWQYAFLAGIYLRKVNNRNTRIRFEICLKLTIWYLIGVLYVINNTGVFIVNSVLFLQVVIFHKLVYQGIAVTIFKFKGSLLMKLWGGGVQSVTFRRILILVPEGFSYCMPAWAPKFWRPKNEIYIYLHYYFAPQVMFLPFKSK